MKAAKTLKNLKEMPYPPKKKAFKKKSKYYYTSKDKCPNFKNFFKMPKIKNLNLSNENKKLSNHAWITSRENEKSSFAS